MTKTYWVLQLCFGANFTKQIIAEPKILKIDPTTATTAIYMNLPLESAAKFNRILFRGGGDSPNLP